MKAKKIMLLALSVLIMIPVIAVADVEKGTTGDDVVRLQLRLYDLDYFNYKATGSFGGMTTTALRSYQEYNNQTINGKITETQFEEMVKGPVNRCPIGKNVSIPIGPSAKEGAPKGDGELEDWFAVIDPMLKVGKEVVITDLNTALTYNASRIGGKNHAHMRLQSAVDETNYKKTIGAEPNWNKRPALVEINGKKYAASVQSFPHGNKIDASSSDDFFCVFFYRSKSDIMNLSDVEHDANVIKASGQ